MMHSEFRNVSTNSVRVEDGSDHVDDLPHAVAEPALDVTIDSGLEVLEALLTGFLHAEPSRLASDARSMQPSRPPEVKAEGLGEGQWHLSRPTATARSPPVCLPALDSRAR